MGWGMSPKFFAILGRLDYQTPTRQRIAEILRVGSLKILQILWVGGPKKLRF